MTLASVQLRMKACVEDLFRLQIKGMSRHGHSDWHDIRKSECEISVVFDVGANTGQSAAKFQIAFPTARIYCFEPVEETFEILQRNAHGHSNINCHKVALGSSTGQSIVYLTGQSSTSSLIKPKTVVASQPVQICTVDQFVLEHRIDRVDLLKIDTEGFDLEVLRGAHQLLSAGQVPFVLTETGFHPGDNRHVLFDDIRSYLIPLGYSLFGIYDQQLEWSGEQRIRYANVCFSNESAFHRR